MSSMVSFGLPTSASGTQLSTSGSSSETSSGSLVGGKKEKRKTRKNRLAAIPIVPPLNLEENKIQSFAQRCLDNPRSSSASSHLPRGRSSSNRLLGAMRVNSSEIRFNQHSNLPTPTSLLCKGEKKGCQSVRERGSKALSPRRLSSPVFNAPPEEGSDYIVVKAASEASILTSGQAREITDPSLILTKSGEISSLPVRRKVFFHLDLLKSKLCRHIERWLKSYEGQIIPTCEQIHQRAERYCLERNEHFLNNLHQYNDISFKSCKETLTPRARQIWQETNNDNILIAQIIQKLQWLQNRLVTFLKKRGERSEWTDALYIHLQQLTKPIGSDGQESNIELTFFVYYFDKCIPQPEIRSLLLSILHENKKEAEQVIGALRYWSNSELSSTTLKRNIDKLDSVYFLSESILTTKHYWDERPKELLTKSSPNLSDSPHLPLSDIKHQEIRRCMYQHKTFLPKKLTINGKEFDSSNIDIRNSDADCERQFWEKLLKQLYDTYYNAYMGERSSQFVRGQVENLFNNKPFFLDQLLKLCTNSCWGHADAYILKLFSKLYSPPYWTKPVRMGTPGMEELTGLACHIRIDEGNYSVTQEKYYATYLRQKPYDINSTAIDIDKVCAYYCFRWTVKPTVTKKERYASWQAILEISDMKIKCDVPGLEAVGKDSFTMKWDILNALTRKPIIEDLTHKFSSSSDDEIPAVEWQ